MSADDMSERSLTQRTTHFDFGENWRSYSELVGEEEIAEAVRGVERLLPEGTLTGRSFLDIGSGSGLHSLAALRLGAERVVAIDLDEESVRTTSTLLSHWAQGDPWSAQVQSVFDLDPAESGTFDVVYSWGVLHHTGAMWAAIRSAAQMVAPDGLLVIALYRRTRLDRLWIREKRWYTSASTKSQARARRVYLALMSLIYRIRGASLDDYKSTYQSSRGMDFEHDVHDWMGGYPYETVAPDEVREFLEPLGFDSVMMPTFKLRTGLLGSGCDEFVLRRVEPRRNS